MASKPWNDKELDILKKMAKRGCTDEEIAQVLLDRSAEGIRHQRKTKKLQQYRFLPKAELDMEAYKRYMEGEGEK